MANAPSRSSTQRILIAEPNRFSRAALARLRQIADVDLEPCPAGAVGTALQNYDVFWFRLGYRLDAATLAQADRCSIVATPVTGLDHIDLEACDRLGITVISLRGEVEFLRDVRATAELTIGLVLALMRGIAGASRHVESGSWDRDAFHGRELYGKTAGLIGVGRVGRLVAGYLATFGMTVIGYDPASELPHEVGRAEGLDQLVEQSDVLSIHARYDASTHHLVDGAVLQRARPDAVLINTSRGGVVDERALIDALRSGRLAGAALDVLEGEPEAVGPAHPLVAYARDHANLLLVPHIGGNTVESFEKTELFLAERVVRALDARRRASS